MLEAPGRQAAAAHCPVLIVEDDADLREMMAQLLMLEGFRTATASNGREALDYLRTGRSPDIILLDLIMPKLQGFDVLRELKQDPTTSSIPVIILSNLGQEQDSKVATEMGAVDYWVKANIGPGEMAKRVEALLGAKEGS